MPRQPCPPTLSHRPREPQNEAANRNYSRFSSQLIPIRRSFAFWFFMLTSQEPSFVLYSWLQRKVSRQSLPGSKMSSMDCLKSRATLKASGKLGSYFSVSIALMVCRETPSYDPGGSKDYGTSAGGRVKTVRLLWWRESLTSATSRNIGFFESAARLRLAPPRK